MSLSTGEAARTPLLEDTDLASLARGPDADLTGRYNGTGFTARVAIPYHPAGITGHYRELLAGQRPEDLADSLSTAKPFKHFGLIISFDAPVDLVVYDEGMRLHEDLRSAIEVFGAIVLRNARANDAGAEEPQTNIFSHLKFHFDRGETQPERYSLFLRDPKSPAQQQPRESSTIIVANVVAYLQALKESGSVDTAKSALRASRPLFKGEDITPMTEAFILEQRWDQPAGTAETTIIDNRTVLHASFYRDAKTAGYPIGVRYLL